MVRYFVGLSGKPTKTGNRHPAFQFATMVVAKAGHEREGIRRELKKWWFATKFQNTIVLRMPPQHLKGSVFRKGASILSSLDENRRAIWFF